MHYMLSRVKTVFGFVYENMNFALHGLLVVFR